MKIKFYFQHEETGVEFKKEFNTLVPSIDYDISEFINSIINGDLKRRFCYKVEIE